jgi:hypothetical protein
LIKRDKVNLDIFWLKDDALEESANLPAPEIIAADITADLEAATPTQSVSSEVGETQTHPKGQRENAPAGNSRARF